MPAVVITSSRYDYPACTGEKVTLTCTINNGISLQWEFDDTRLRHYGPSDTCGVYDPVDSSKLNGASFPANTEMFTVSARDDTSDVVDDTFNCTSLLDVTVYSPFNGTFKCTTTNGTGSTAMFKNQYVYNVIGKNLDINFVRWGRGSREGWSEARRGKVVEGKEIKPGLMYTIMIIHFRCRTSISSSYKCKQNC